MTKSILDGKDFKLGLFSSNCSSGMAVTKVEDRWTGSWDDNLRLAKIADEVGIDFLLPIAGSAGHETATVDVEHRAGDVRRLGAGEEKDRVHALAKIRHPVQGDGVEHFVAILVTHGVEHAL